MRCTPAYKLNGPAAFGNHNTINYSSGPRLLKPILGRLQVAELLEAMFRRTRTRASMRFWRRTRRLVSPGP